MGEITEAYYNLGRALFESGEYEEALLAFINAYNEGGLELEIVTDINNCYVLPNEDEFRMNYRENCGNDTLIRFEETSLDFIPVTDTKFYIFDKNQQKFESYIDVKDINITQNSFAESILIADTGDIRNMLPFLKEISQIFILTEGVAQEFYSFCKLPGFKMDVLSKVVVFDEIQELKDYFNTNLSVLLPRKIAANKLSKYRLLVDEIHKERLENVELKEIRPLLSICIPSYNRGQKALRAVKRVLESNFDSEIEIVISNNGSTLNQEGYEEIKRMSDARIHYFEFAENQGYASNIKQVLSMARGKYAVLSSDEDVMVIEQLPAFLQYLKTHDEFGFIATYGIGPNFMQAEEKQFAYGKESLSYAINRNYITGIAYQTDRLKEAKAFDKFDSLRGNMFLEYYTHIFFAMLASQHSAVCQSGILLWQSVEEPDEADDGGILSYMWPQSRIEQQNSCVELLSTMLELEDTLFSDMLYERMEKAYYLLYLAYYFRSDAFEKEFTWRDICLEVQKNNISLVDQYLKHESQEKWKWILSDLFFYWMNKHPLKDKMDSAERVKLEAVNKLAEYLVEKGMPVLSIPFKEIEERIG